MAYEQQIYKRNDTGKLYSIVNGTAREFVDQEAAAKLNPNAQGMDWGQGTSGYSSQYGGGTTGGAWTTADFTDMLNKQAQTQALNQAAEQAAAKSNAQVASSVPVAPTDFQKYFQAELAKGRAAGDILSSNPFMAGQAQGPALQASAVPQAPVAPAPQAPSPATTYAGNSIVDYLKSAGKATDFASRAKIAAEQGIVGYKGTAEQNLQLLNKLRAAQPKPPVSGSIAADKAFEKQSAFDLSKTQAPAVVKDSTTEQSNTLQQSIDENLKAMEGEKTSNEILAEKSTSRAMQLLADSLGRSKMLTEEEKKAGIDEYKTNLKNLKNEIATKTAAYEKLYADIQGKPITMNSIIGADAQARKVAQADLGFLNAQALAMQNNIDFAKQTAQDAVDAKYGPIDEEINILAKQLELIQPTLDKEEKLRADAVKLALDQRKEALDAIKAKETTLTNFNIDMIQKYPSAGIKTTDDYATTQKKVTASAEYKADMAKATASDDKVLSPTEAAALGVKYGTTQSQAAAMGIDVKSVKQELTPEDKMKTEITLSKQVQGATKEAVEAVRNINLINTSLSAAKQQLAQGKDIGSSSQAIITAFNKILDPNSVVRESEYARTSEGSSLLNRLDGALTKLQSGGAGLSIQSLEEYANLGKEFMNNYNDSQVNTLKQVRNQTESYGLNLDNVISPQAKSLLEQADLKDLTDFYQNQDEATKSKIDQFIKENPGVSDYDIQRIFSGGFNSESQTSLNGQTAKLASIPNDVSGGQCGRFVNQLTGLGVGNSYKSKMEKMDPTIKVPEPGMVFTMPYKDTGHIGFILSIKDGIATVKDSNWFINSDPEKVKTHQIPVSQMTGFRRVNITA